MSIVVSELLLTGIGMLREKSEKLFMSIEK